MSKAGLRQTSTVLSSGQQSFSIRGVTGCSQPLPAIEICQLNFRFGSVSAELSFHSNVRLNSISRPNPSFSFRPPSAHSATRPWQLSTTNPADPESCQYVKRHHWRMRRRFDKLTGSTNQLIKIRPRNFH